MMVQQSVAMPPEWALVGFVVTLLGLTLFVLEMRKQAQPATVPARLANGAAMAALLAIVWMSTAGLIWRCPTWFCG